MSSIAIIIPARYGSSRFPGKPLAEIGGRSMIARVVDIARNAADSFPSVEIAVATDDSRIAEHAETLGAHCIMTAEACRTGSDRVLEAAKQLAEKPDFVVNLQGDAPFTPVSVLQAIIEAYLRNPEQHVITPVHRLSWDDLDRLRDSKKATPFSGTTAVIDENGRALWFSKNIIPAIRKEDELRAAAALSPVYQHIGVYGYRSDILEKFCSWPESAYEKLEGLEQLRLIENGVTIQTVEIEIASGMIQSGIDTPEDLARAEALLDSY